MSEQQPPYPSYPPPGAPMAPPAVPYAGGPQPAYASWISRVVANILDGFIELLVGLVPGVIGVVILVQTSETTTTTTESGTTTTITDTNPLGIVLLVLAGVLMVVFLIWNVVFRQGRRGATVGKSMMRIKVVRQADGQVLGAGMAFVRYVLMSILGGICFLNYLWPLWDPRNQTWHDMLVSSVVVKD